MATQAELEQRIADLEKRIAQLQAEAEPSGGVFTLLDQLVPPETRQHMRAARREQLLALRSILDKWIARMDDDAPAPRREAIRVD